MASFILNGKGSKKRAMAQRHKDTKAQRHKGSTDQHPKDK